MKKIKGVVAIMLSVMLMGVFCSCGSTEASSSVGGGSSSKTDVGSSIFFGSYE